MAADAFSQREDFTVPAADLVVCVHDPPGELLV
jgi:hypothetical protein